MASHHPLSGAHPLPSVIQGSAHPRSDTISGGDKSIMKVSCKTAPHGAMGQKYLAAGIHMGMCLPLLTSLSFLIFIKGMRMWEDEKPGEPHPVTSRDYEVLGFVVSGRAELHLEGKTTCR